MKTSSLPKKVLDTIEQNEMLTPGEPVGILVGLSGGADSVCLLWVLKSLADAGQIQCSLRAVHVHHGLRKAADEDERFVRQLCEDGQIPLEVRHIDTRGYAEQHGLGTEEAGHILRGRIFEEAARQWEQEERAAGGNFTVCIALAHHLEDQVETQLFHMARGSEIRGLAGIRPVSVLGGLEQGLNAEGTGQSFLLEKDEEEQTAAGPSYGEGTREHSPRERHAGLARHEFSREGTGRRLIRPLIRATRAEIEDCLREAGIAWRTDESNTDETYSRNLIRHQILPALEKVNPAALEHCARLSEEAAETENYLERQTNQAWDRCAIQLQHGTCITQISLLLQEEPLIQRRLLYRILSACAGRRKDIARDHVESLLGLCRKGGSGELDLPYGLRARKIYDVMVVGQKGAVVKNAAEADSGGRVNHVAEANSGGRVNHVAEANSGGRINPVAEADSGRRINPVTEAGSGKKVHPERESCSDTADNSNTAAVSAAAGTFAAGELTPTEMALLSGAKQRFPLRPEVYQTEAFPYSHDPADIPRNKCTKWFDYDKIHLPVVFRTRKTGDRMTISSDGASKPLTRLMIDMKIPAGIRDRIVLPFSGQEVLWIPEGRISARYLVDTSTEKILQIQLV